MKHLKMIAILAGLILLQGCDSNTPIDEDALSRKAYDSIEEFLAKDMQDPLSLEVQFTTLPVRIDTIKAPDLFPGRKEGYAILALYTGKNTQSGYFLKEQMFYVTLKGECYQNQAKEKLTEKEILWLRKNSIVY